MSVWEDRTERLLEEAITRLRAGEGDSVLMAIGAAEAAFRIEMGELSAEEMDGYPFPGEEWEGPSCICPPELVAHGGFKGSCPAIHLMPVESS